MPNPAEIDVVTQVVCCVSTDREEALRRARIHVGQLVLNPVSDGVVAAHGLEKQRDEVRAALVNGGPAALADVTGVSLPGYAVTDTGAVTSAGDHIL